MKYSLWLLLLTIGTVDAGAVYWTDRASGAKAIRRMGMNGSSPTTTTPLLALATGADPRGIAVDTSAGKLYYGSLTQIIQANLDGTGSSVKISGRTAVRDLKLDRPTNYLYWADQTGGNIQRALTSDFIINASYAKLATDVYYLDLYRVPGNTSNPLILWGDSNTSIWITGVDVSWITPNFSWGPGSSVRGVCVDSENQMLYWNEKDAKMVRRAKLKINGEVDSTTIQNLYTGLNAPHGLVLDLPARKLYWVDSGTNGTTGFGRSGVNRGDLDGAGAAEALIGPSSTLNAFAGQPWDLDLDPRTLTYDEWKARYFRIDAPLSQTGPGMDPDGDGMKNFAEYAQGTPPLVAGANPQLRALSISVSGTNYPAIQFSRRIGVTDVNYFVQVSTSLGAWQDNVHTPSAGVTPITVETSITPLDDGMELVTTRSNTPYFSQARQFLQVLMEAKP